MASCVGSTPDDTTMGPNDAAMNAAMVESGPMTNRRELANRAYTTNGTMVA